MLIGKYYPSLFTQFIIGCVCYAVSFMILKDLIMDTTCEQYKYHVILLVMIDATYLVYRSKSTKDQNISVSHVGHDEPKKKSQNTSTDIRSNSMYSVSLSSEINDYKITHDLSTSDAGANSMFSTSDEKSDTKPLVKKIMPTEDEKAEASLASINLDSE